MKARILQGLFLAIALVAIAAAPSQAAGQWYTCSVVMAGPSGTSTVFIRLTDTAASPAFTGKWFKSLTGRENQMLAATLTAISSGLQLYVFVDLAEAGYPSVTSCYVKAP